VTLKITSWNVNSIRKRLDGLTALVEDQSPDVICLQETKVTNDLFPRDDVAALGYPHQAIHGMKGYNGVAILSKLPLIGPDTKSWKDPDDCRHVFAGIDAGPNRGEIEVHCLYVPAGGDLPDPVKNPKFSYKLDFLSALAGWWAARGSTGMPRVLAGDFNVAPLVTDVWSHERLKNVVSHTEIEIEHLIAMQEAGNWIDAVRSLLPETEPVYTWWSYRSPDWETADKGRRLDHIWVSPDLVGALDEISIHRDARSWATPSDHVPVTLVLET